TKLSVRSVLASDRDSRCVFFLRPSNSFLKSSQPCKLPTLILFQLRVLREGSLSATLSDVCLVLVSLSGSMGRGLGIEAFTR
ncbi:unnamed protein product, partial [Ixodes pacificus]